MVRIITLLVGMLLSLPVYATDTAAPASTPDPELVKQYSTALPDDYLLGNKDAPVTVIEYASLSCSHCAHFYQSVFPVIKEKYIDTGKIKFIYRDFPLNPPALHAAMLARCVEKDQYYNFIKVLFKTQDSWAYQKNYIELLANIAKLGGVSSETFDACMKNKPLEDKLLDGRLKAGKLFNIEGTPSFIINGKKYSAMDADKFSSTLDALFAASSEKEKPEGQ